jgi:excisionase family DNA binding protein
MPEAQTKGSAAMPSMLVTKEIAEAYRVSEQAVHAWRRQGKLPFIRLPGRGYRYRREDVYRVLGALGEK